MQIIVKLYLFTSMSLILIKSFSDCYNCMSHKRQHYPGVTPEECGYNFDRYQVLKDCVKSLDENWDDPRRTRYARLPDFNFIQAHGRISNGLRVRAGELPYNAYILYKDKGGWAFCTGSIINEYWIMTAAHCLDDGVKATTVSVRVGTNNRYKGGQVLKARATYIYPLYDADDSVRVGTTRLHDIGLIKLKTRIVMNGKNDLNAQAVCLPERNYRNVNKEKAMLSGWGFTDRKKANLTNPLMKAEFVINAIDEAKNAMIFANGSDPGMCAGDSGGPLVQSDDKRAVQIGVVGASDYRKGEHCSKSIVYLTRVAFYVDWIVETVTKDKTRNKIKTKNK